QDFERANEALAMVQGVFPDGLPVEVELELQNLKSRIAVATGDSAADIAALERTIELDPLDGQALIFLGEQRRRAGEPEEAELLFDRAIALEDFESEASLAKAKLLVDADRFSDAVPLLERANELEPSTAIENYLTQVRRMAKER
ncbi:MAG: tetratricopeptide repeat protein, partial [Planctomycetota bacterium]